MASADELLDGFGRWAASNPGEAHSVDRSTLRLKVLENGEYWNVVVSDLQLFKYLKQAGVDSIEELRPTEMDTYWADLSRRLSAAISMWKGTESVLSLNGDGSPFEPEYGTERLHSSPSGPPPAGLTVVRAPKP